MSFVLDTESALTGWVGVSMLLLPTSILLYHVTGLETPTLQMHPYAAGFVVIGLILIGVTFAVSALIPYNTRTTQHDADHGLTTTRVGMEESYKIMYTVFVSFLVLLELVICVYIVKDMVKRMQRRKLSNV